MSITLRRSIIFLRGNPFILSKAKPDINLSCHADRVLLAHRIICLSVTWKTEAPPGMFWFRLYSWKETEANAATTLPCLQSSTSAELRKWNYWLLILNSRIYKYTFTIKKTKTNSSSTDVCCWRLPDSTDGRVSTIRSETQLRIEFKGNKSSTCARTLVTLARRNLADLQRHHENVAGFWKPVKLFSSPNAAGDVIFSQSAEKWREIWLLWLISFTSHEHQHLGKFLTLSASLHQK